LEHFYARKVRWSAELRLPETKIVFPAELANLVYD